MLKDTWRHFSNIWVEISLTEIKCKRHRKPNCSVIIDIGLFFLALSIVFLSAPLLPLFALLNHAHCYRPHFLLPMSSPGLLFADIFLWHNMKKCWEIKNWSLLSMWGCCLPCSLATGSREREREREQERGRRFCGKAVQAKVLSGFP